VPVTPSLSPTPDAGQAAPSSRPFRPTFWLVTGVAFLLAAGGIALLVDLARPRLTPAASDALEILTQVKAEVIPAENRPTRYGVAFNAAGYETLLMWKDRYPINPSRASDFEALNVTLPCCAFTTPSADESKNCGCGHHLAVYGLAKKLLADGYNRAETQAEIARWVAYLFPQEALKAELERRALTDPVINQALQELKEKGEC
jgi:hypothetical protein